MSHQEPKAVRIASHKEDMFTSGAQAIVNPVNCVGTLGKGLALAFKQRFPGSFEPYFAACRARRLRPGGIVVESTGGSDPEFIVNLATKDHWRNPSKIEWVRQGARELREWAEREGVSTVACPALGAGNGQLEWNDVKQEILVAFEGSPVQLILFEPHELKAPAAPERSEPSASAPRASAPGTAATAAAGEENALANSSPAPARHLGFRRR